MQNSNDKSFKLTKKLNPDKVSSELEKSKPKGKKYWKLNQYFLSSTKRSLNY